MRKIYLLLFLSFGYYLSIFAQSYSMMVRSASIKSIYRQCENPLYVDINSPCDVPYTPKIAAQNAEIWQDSFQKNKIYLFPMEGNTCLLRFYNGNIKMGQERLRIIEPPKPHISISVNGVKYEKKMRISKGSRVSVRIQADEKFEETLHDEAKYGISGLEIREQGHGGGALVAKLDFTNSAYRQEMLIPIPAKVFDGPKGKLIYLTLENVYRINSKGGCINDTRFPFSEKQIILITK